MTTHKEWKCPICGDTNGPYRILTNATVRESLEMEESEDGSFELYPVDTLTTFYMGEPLYECCCTTCSHQTGDVNEFLVDVDDETE